MPTIAAGSRVRVHCPLSGTITITPGTSGRVTVGGSNAVTGASIEQRQIRSELVLAVAADDVVQLEAFNNDATYSVSAGSSYTWATRPNAADFAVGSQIRITDIPSGGAGTIFVSDGIRWCCYQPTELAASSVALPALAGTTTAARQVTVILPGGLLGPNGSLDIRATTTATGTAGTKLIYMRIGVNQIYSFESTSVSYIGSHAIASNRNAENSQVAAAVNVEGMSGSGIRTLSVTATDTSVDQEISISMKLGNAGDSMTLQAWRMLFTSRT